MRKDDLTGTVRTRGSIRLDVEGNKSLVGPVRTRGRLRLGKPGNAPTAVKTRGAVRTRGALPGSARAPRADPVAESIAIETLDGLVQALRQAADGVPITVLIHDSDGPASRDFVRTLRPTLQHDDALWLVASDGGDAGTLSSELDEATMLDLSQDTDQRIYANLVCDLVFFPGVEGVKDADVQRWRRRTSALVIDARGGQVDALIEAGRKADLLICGWSGGDALNAPPARRAT